MVSTLQSWPEPVVRVQSLSDSGINAIPECYVKPIYDRPSLLDLQPIDANIPVIDLANLDSDDPTLRKTTLDLISDASRQWGFFQVINHGVSHHLMESTRRIWREFFHLPLHMKQEYANSPTTYEGYGSRLGVEKGAKLDWSDYFFLHFLPVSMRDERKWPAQPLSCREVVGEYNEEVMKLCGKLMRLFSLNLGLEEDYLEKAFGGDEIGASLRVNFYPKCPQPDLTLGISPHSDPGGITILLPDDHVSGLQVRKDDAWVTVISNAKYRSVEHRVIVNSNEERVSLAFFYNPKGDILIQPAKQLITNEEPALYPPMTFNEYRTFIRLNGLHGKSQVESLKSPR
ncbi:Non-heme dioxygenase N-terminal domain-containing protein [Cynara cardunculus var. scolymus]|uniref:Non-heme dioxygenase N-terminal domain-containing protein n=1 Tax=Cynara cardunculus var. scolymus TaxID=59895 RepID=A0A103XQ51_CYNCS|nr:Non-heme dioxygenase N-terminal domain-containing protein [Cynara cardunculus var. scolymus]